MAPMPPLQRNKLNRPSGRQTIDIADPFTCAKRASCQLSPLAMTQLARSRPRLDASDSLSPLRNPLTKQDRHEASPKDLQYSPPT